MGKHVLGVQGVQNAKRETITATYKIEESVRVVSEMSQSVKRGKMNKYKRNLAAAP